MEEIMKRGLLLAGLLTLFVSAPALAHFQMLYTPESALERGGEMTLKLVFTHPFDAGYTMDMAPVQEFYVVQQRGEEAEPEKVDLMEYLKPISWASLTNSGAAYEANLPTKVVRSMGDYVFVLVPGPYYEEKEDIYIQQLTKMMVNVGGVPGNWHQPLGLPAEIAPLDKPYANWTGGVFRGVVMSAGKPVPHAELEVEYLNHAPNMEKNAFEKEAGIEAPHTSLEVLGIRANAQGEFVIGLPKAGWWGIAALGVGSEDEHNGKELSQDAVLWIQVTDIP
jgi:cobalt/nickel transport protein